MQNHIQMPFDIDIFGYVVVDEAEVLVPGQMFDIPGMPGGQVIDCDHLIVRPPAGGRRDASR